MTAGVAAIANEGDAMAVVIATTISGGDREMYEAVAEKAMAGELPEGCQVHIAGPVSGGWRVITVWDSEEAFNRFRQEKLTPALLDVRGRDAVAPSVDANPVHRLMKA
jgi:hypothetical protein